MTARADSSTIDRAGSPTASARPIAVALVVAVAFFMENLDGTIITTAIPEMAHSFGRTPVELSIGVTAYLLALTVLIPISGWVADRLGARLVFCTAIAVFTAASVLCGMAGSLGWFTAARVLQGVGGAMMVPVGRMVVLREARKEDLMRAIAYITWPGLAAPVIGPPIGGLLSEYASWRWIFFLNVPLGLIGLWFAVRLVPARVATERRPFDWRGFVLSGVACTGLLYGLDHLSEEEAALTVPILLVVVSVAIAVAAVWHLRRARSPLIDLSTLKVHTFRVPMLGGSLFRVAIGGTPFVLPLMLQVGFGMSAFRSGLLVLAVFAGNLLMKPATTPVLRRFGFRSVLLANGVLAAASIAVCALFSASTPTWLLVLVLFAGGLFRSMQFSAQMTLAFADVPPRQMSSASTLSSMVIQLSMALGVALAALVVQLSQNLLPDSAGAATPYRIAFLVLAAICLLALFDASSLPRDAADDVSGHRSRRREARGRESAAGSPS